MNNKRVKEQCKNRNQEKEEAAQRQMLKHTEDERILILNDSCMVATLKHVKKWLIDEKSVKNW